MNPRNLAPRLLALTLSASLALPPSAFALRQQGADAQKTRAGLEERLGLVKSLPGFTPGAGLEEGLGQRLKALLPVPADVIITDLDGTVAPDARADVDPALRQRIREWLKLAGPKSEFIFLSTRSVEDIKKRIHWEDEFKNLPPTSGKLLIYGHSGGSDPAAQKRIQELTGGKPVLSDSNLQGALAAAAKINKAWPGAGQVSLKNVAQNAIDPTTQRAEWKAAVTNPTEIFKWEETNNPGHLVYQYGRLSVFVPKDPSVANIAMLSYGPAAKGAGLLAPDEVRKGLDNLFDALTKVMKTYFPGAKIGRAAAGGTTLNIELLNKADFLRLKFLASGGSYAKRKLLFLDDEGRKGGSGYEALLLGLDAAYGNLVTIAVDGGRVDDALRDSSQNQGSRLVVAAVGRKGPETVDQVLSIEVNKKIATGLEEKETATPTAEASSVVRSLSQLPEVRVAVIAAEAVAGQSPELAGLAGQPPKQIGDAWLVVLPQGAGLEEFTDLLLPFMGMSSPVALLEYGPADAFSSLNVMARDIFRILGPWSLEGKDRLSILRQVFANLAGLEEEFISDADFEVIEEVLGIGQQL